VSATTADYGTQVPEHFDRFGVRHHVTIYPERGMTRTFLDANPNGLVRRLSLTLRHWARRWPGMEIFHLDVNGRPLEIRSYADGRIKLLLDDAPVYQERIKVVTRHGVKYRETDRWYDPTVAAEEAEYERRQRHADTYAELKRGLANPANTPDDAMDIMDSVPQYTEGPQL
jgi:hypothetical protein